MRLDEILKAVRSSDRKDWNIIPGYGSLYRDRLIAGEVGGQRYLTTDSHSYVAAYRANTSITIAWGMTNVHDFQEPWAQQFPDKHATSSFVDIFFNNALVFRHTY